MKWAYFKLKSLRGEKGIKCPLQQDGRVLSRFWTVAGHKQILSPGSPHSQLPQHWLEDETGVWDIGTKGSNVVLFQWKTDRLRISRKREVNSIPR